MDTQSGKIADKEFNAEQLLNAQRNCETGPEDEHFLRALAHVSWIGP